jgi:acyl carrier protein
MKVYKFIEILKETIEIESTELTEETNLLSLPEYDSLAVMSLIALIDEHFNQNLTAAKLATISTVKSLIELIGLENFEE